MTTRLITRPGRSRSGMTLMELVIALAITGMMATAGATAFSSIVDHRRAIRESAISTERAAAFREMVHSWLAAGTIQIPRGGGPTGGRSTMPTTTTSTTASAGSNTSSVTAAQAAGDELTFTTTALNPALTPNIRIRMYVDADANTPETGLAIEYQPNAQQPIVRKMLDSTVDSLVVEYLDTQTNRWYSATEAATITPRAMRFHLHSTDSTASPLLALPMTVVIGNPSSRATARP